MTTQELKQYIDKAIGTKGVFNRLPAWWMNKTLSELADSFIPISQDFTNDFNENFSI
jgi:hypothetical protein